MDIFTTIYCNHPHRMSDGEPVGHRCRRLPVVALIAEQQGDIETMISALEARPFQLSEGIPAITQFSDPDTE